MPPKYTRPTDSKSLTPKGETVFSTCNYASPKIELLELPVRSEKVATLLASSCECDNRLRHCSLTTIQS